MSVKTLALSGAITLLLALSATAALPQSPPIAPDRLETGLQGQSRSEEATVLARPYTKGVRVIGHEPILGRDSNVQLTWADHCAYVASMPPKFLGWAMKPNNLETTGVAVIDVADPRAPQLTGLLREKGAMYSAETMHAVSVPGRKVLAAGAYAGGHEGAKPEDAAWLDIYDVSDCAHPRLTAEVKWPENAHTITVSPNGRRVYGTSIDPFTGKGGIQVFDISDMAHPRYLGKFGLALPDGSIQPMAVHEISLSPDERRIYAGVLSSTAGGLGSVKLMPLRYESLAPDAGGIAIIDNSDIGFGRPNPKLRLIGTAPGGGWHSVMRARIRGVPYLVGAAELGACPGAWPRITRISDERHPVRVGEFRLAMNRAENCPPQDKAEAASHGLAPRLGTATAHFNDVDSATDTRLGLFNFMWGGLRIVDLRDPARPTEVAYFKPGDACTGHVRYLPETGQIWLTCAASGLWVLELKPELRRALGLPAISGARRH
ncbi:MAG: hypothetical protein JF593_11130 [Novosphingobium sp.]|nr:hypothetical protein [Novosphingobium sp.]